MPPQHDEKCAVLHGNELVAQTAYIYIEKRTWYEQLIIIDSLFVDVKDPYDQDEELSKLRIMCAESVREWYWQSQALNGLYKSTI